jgi:hypothetical protein
MSTEFFDLINACADLVSLQQNDPFVVGLLTEMQAGEWVPVQSLCRDRGLPLREGASNLFVTWLADPLGNSSYVVIIFYDDDSKWTTAAHYNRQRHLSGNRT